MMMIAAGGNECRLPAEALHQLEAEHAAIEGERPVDSATFRWTWPIRTPASIGPQLTVPCQAIFMSDRPSHFSSNSLVLKSRSLFRKLLRAKVTSCFSSFPWR